MKESAKKTCIVQKARDKHPCSLCLNIIEPGTIYVSFRAGSSYMKKDHYGNPIYSPNPTIKFHQECLTAEGIWKFADNVIYVKDKKVKEYNAKQFLKKI